jgi:hypothetical protein
VTSPLVSRLAVAAGVVFVIGVAAVPAVGQGSSTPAATAACPKSPSSQDPPTFGYSLSAEASGLHAEVDSPGLLPTGDATIGEIIGADVPLARELSSGTGTASLSSPVYPGDTVAHLGTALSTFGAPPVVPNDPVLAESDYPPSPGHAAIESFSTAGLPLQAATALSTATATGGTATSHIISTDLGASFSAGAADAATAVDLQASCVDASARSTTAGVIIAGVVRIAGVSGYAAARSDGQTAVPQAELQLGKVTVAGLAAYIDRDGVHLATQSVGAGAIAAAETALRTALAASGTTIALVKPTTTIKGGSATADSGAVIVTTKQILPGVGHPPQGTPPIPLVLQLSYGHVHAIANGVVPPGAESPATTVASGGGTALPSTNGGPAPPTGQGGTPAATTPAPTSQPLTPLAASPGSQVYVASGASLPPRGSPVPTGWILVGLAASIVAIGPLLGYARWQLLEGRI